MCPQFFSGQGRQVGGGDVKHGLAAGDSTGMELVNGPGESDQYAGGELRVGIQLQTVLNYMLVFAMDTGGAGADYKAAVGQIGMIPS